MSNIKARRLLDMLSTCMFSNVDCTRNVLLSTHNVMMIYI